MDKDNKYIRDGRSPVPEKESTSRIMSAIKGKDTKPEKLVRKYLWISGYRGYRLNWTGAKGVPDICYVGRRIAIFINGCFWHRCPYCNPHIPKSHTEFWLEKFKKTKKRDKTNYKILIKMGWEVFVLWDCKISANVESELRGVIDVLKKFNLNR